ETARLAEHVRMAPYQLFGQALDDVGKVEGPLLLRHAGMEDDLQQEIAQFIAQVIEIASRNGIGDLVSLLDGIGGDRLEGLLQVQRTAAAARARRRHDFEQPGDVAVAGRGHRRIDEGADDSGPYNACRQLSRILRHLPLGSAPAGPRPGRGARRGVASSVPIPKFASLCRSLVCELRNPRTLATY